MAFEAMDIVALPGWRVLGREGPALNERTDRAWHGAGLLGGGWKEPVSAGTFHSEEATCS